jgi:murein DD-endopeptidase MepM/ murein hydrolase activator NlpD
MIRDIMARARRYKIMVLDTQGRSRWRFTITNSSLTIVTVFMLATFIGGVFLALQATTRQNILREAARIRAQNEDLKLLQMAVDKALPEAQQVEQRAALTFSQVWSKSGLGPQPQLLGQGPITQRDAVRILDAQRLPPPNIDLWDVPNELNRMVYESPKLHSQLSELLEYFHDADRLLSNTPSIKPTTSKWQTSGFGRRKDPMTGQRLMHKGIDLAGQVGDPIFAPADGVVIFRGRRGGYGQSIVLDHGYGIQTHFAHLNKYVIRLGDVVSRGQVIAEMGNTGKSTGPHLHYEVRRFGQPLDPEAFVMNYGLMILFSKQNSKR